jgi:hypothetical protein
MATAKTLKPKQSTGKAPASDAFSQKEARDRFERAVDVAVATKPMHRETVPARKRRQK